MEDPGPSPGKPRSGRTKGKNRPTGPGDTRGSAARGQSQVEATHVDDIMEQASRALGEMRYFDAASLALRSLAQARAGADFDRLARICLPLQEARRNIRLAAVDATPASGVPVIASPDDIAQPLAPGCLLFQPPLIGADARSLRATSDRLRLPIFVLTREPFTRDERWPVVGVGKISTRVKIKPPFELAREDARITKDSVTGGSAVPIRWFEEAGERLGDTAIQAVPDMHPWWRVDAFISLIEAVPLHEKLYQALAAACREAQASAAPTSTRAPAWNYDDLMSPD